MKRIVILIVTVCMFVGLYYGYEYLRLYSPYFDKTVIETPRKVIPILSGGKDYIMLGDTGSGSESQYTVAKAIQTHCEEADCTAAFIAGDIIYDNGVTSVDDPNFQLKFEEPYKELSFPFHIAFGNHDYRGCVDCYIQYSKLSKKWVMPAHYYVQEYEDIAFFVIDTENFDGEQQTWLRKVLQENDSIWKIIVGHRPLITNELSYINEQWNGKKELQDIICKSADVYVAGHAHIMEDLGAVENCTVTQLITGGGGAYLRNARQDKVGNFTYRGFGFINIKNTADTLIYSIVDSKGDSIYSNLLEKE